MKIVLISVGIMKENNLRELSETYSKRIPHYFPFETLIIPDVNSSKSATVSSRKEKESSLIISKINPGDYVVLFDERGKELTSRQFAEFIDKKSISLNKNLIFIIGGPFGFSQDLYNRADTMLSLSRMTFTHEMARTLALEQIYRAMTILRGEPYHHD